MEVEIQNSTDLVPTLPGDDFIPQQSVENPMVSVSWQVSV